jgi:hypothetical protein
VLKGGARDWSASLVSLLALVLTLVPTSVLNLRAA